MTNNLSYLKTIHKTAFSKEVFSTLVLPNFFHPTFFVFIHLVYIYLLQAASGRMLKHTSVCTLSSSKIKNQRKIKRPWKSNFSKLSFSTMEAGWASKLYISSQKNIREMTCHNRIQRYLKIGTTSLRLGPGHPLGVTLWTGGHGFKYRKVLNW